MQNVDPRRPYDQEYSQFVSVASRLVSLSLTSIVLHEEDIGRRERAITTAEIIKSELRQQLLESQKEANRNHLKFQVSFFPTALQLICTDGVS
jgi:hypothetical protein